VSDALLTSQALWLLAAGLPLCAVPFLASKALGRFTVAVAPWTAVPALVLALTVEPGVFVDVPWLLVGARLGLDETGRVFLTFTSGLWIVAGIYARGYLEEDPDRTRFFAFFLVSMAGNLGLILAADMITFYLSFAVMSFSSYGLVTHHRDPEALWAGRVYISLVVIGEALVFVGILATAGVSGRVDFAGAPAELARSPSASLILVFLIVGFGIKVGALPLHVWLPLAHPAAPTPASAVLSGTMIKAGLLGWLRFLPLGEAAFPGWGMTLVVAGVAAAYWGVLVGVTQDNPKVVLAYSSISQMGLMTMGVGAALLAPAAWPMLMPAILVYAMHHALAKGALFLGTGVAPAARLGTWLGRVTIAGLAFPALALAGVPFTSGAVSKIALKGALDSPPVPAGYLELLASVAAIGTTVLMARFLAVTAWQRQPSGNRLKAGVWIPWMVSVGAAVSLVWLLPWPVFREAGRAALAPQYIWMTLWPPVVGAALAWGVWRMTQRAASPVSVRVPTGDVLAGLLWAVHRFGRLSHHGARLAVSSWFPRYGSGAWTLEPAHAVLGAEKTLARWHVVGLLLLTLAAALLALLGVWVAG
jgi:formate hydrogenlyase subunit 3/multisubunit Na+/H+ antiporter MnhD subunit